MKKNKKRKIRKSIKFLFICHFVTVKPTYVAQWVHFDDLNRNSHTCQRSTIEIDEREKISRFHHCHVIFLYPEIFRRTKTNFLKICNEKIWNPFHSKVTRNILHNFLVLSSRHSGYFYTCCNAKSPKTFYFQLCNLIWHVWRGGGLKEKSWDFLYHRVNNLLTQIYFILSISSNEANCATRISWVRLYENINS